MLRLDKIPVTGDTITFENLTFTVLATRGRRILKVRVVRNLETKEEETSVENTPEVLLLPSPQERERRTTHKEEEAIPAETSDFEYREA